MFANEKDCRQYIYPENDTISDGDLFTVYGNCGFYGITFADLRPKLAGLNQQEVDERIDLKINSDQDTGSSWGFSAIFVSENLEVDGNINLKTQGRRIALAGTNGISANGEISLFVDSQNIFAFRQRLDGSNKNQIVMQGTGAQKGVELRYNGSNSGAGLITREDGGDLRGTWTGTVTSDERLKQNITSRDGLNNILALNGVPWDWKPGKEIKGADKSGFTAQNWATVYPEQVIEEDGVLKIFRSVDTQVFEADLVEAIKAQQEQINQLKQIIEQMTGQSL